MRRLALIAMLVGACSRAPAEPKQVRVYFLGGQSNMEGYGRVEELPAGAAEVPGVYIFHGTQLRDRAPPDRGGRWLPLRPGHGAGFAFEGDEPHYVPRFGPELAFASELRARDPGTPIAIIKYARGGTSIAPGAVAGCWATDVDYPNQLDHAVATISRALAQRDVDGDGALDVLVPAGIAWMQGESDATSEEAARSYRANLAGVLGALRGALGGPELPVAIGQIADSGRADDGRVWDHAERVRAAQAELAAADPHAALVPTDGLGFSDPAHYDSRGYLALGRALAAALAGAR